MLEKVRKDKIRLYRKMLTHVRKCLHEKRDIDGKFNKYRNALLKAPGFIQLELDYVSDGTKMYIWISVLEIEARIVFYHFDAFFEVYMFAGNTLQKLSWSTKHSTVVKDVPEERVFDLGNSLV